MKVSKKVKAIISAVLMVVMVITMLPMGQLVKAADEKASSGMDINIHFYDTKDAYEGKVYLQYWQEGTATITVDGEVSKGENFATWKVTRYALADESATVGAGWYGLNIKGSVQGFQFLNEDGEKNTRNSYLPKMKQYSGDLYYKDGKWYAEDPVKNADAKEADLKLDPAEVYYLVGNVPGVSNDAESLTNPLEKQKDGTYSITLENVVPGSYWLKVLQDPENFAWDKAWCGTGAGGNYELELTKKSNVIISVDPAKADYKVKVDIEAAKSNVAVKSPVYNNDKTMTFNYVSTVSQASIGVRGNLVSSQKKNLLKINTVEKLEDGSFLYVATSSAITKPGIYKYSFYEMKKDGQLGEELGDPASTALYAGTGAFVRNPVVNKAGLVTVYCPDGQDGMKVIYKSATSENKNDFKAGDQFTEAKAAEYGYTVVKMTEDKEFAGGGMYSAKFFDDNGTYNYLVVDENNIVAKDPYNYTGSSTFKEEDVDKVALSVKSPVVKENGDVEFMLYDSSLGTDAKACVAGQFNDWTKDKDMMTPVEGTEGVYSLTMKNFKPGKYQYKFVVNGNWMPDPLCKFTVGNDGNSELIVPGLAPETAVSVEKGKSVTLPAIAVKYEENTDKTSTADVTYELKDTKTTGATIKDGILSVDADYAQDTVELVISDGKTKSDCSIEVVGKKYKYTLHYYAEDSSTYADRDMWIWEQSGKAYNEGYVFNETTSTDTQGRVWANATYEFPSNALYAIVRSKGGWTYQETQRTLTIPEGQEEGEFWLVQGSSRVFTEYADKFDLGVRYIVAQYDRPAKDYEGWNLYTWNATDAYNKKSNMFTEVNGIYQTIFAIDEATENVGYLLRDGTPEDENDWSKINKDGGDGDRSIKTPKDQKVIKVKLTQGVLEAEYYPYNKGYEMNPDEKKITFYYRDDDLFLEGSLHTLRDVQVEINGTNYPMVYSAKNERFEYTLENAASGDYKYCYHVTDAEGQTSDKLDLFNERVDETGTKSVVTYKDLTTNVFVTKSSETINYDQNALLSVAVDNPEVTITEAYADLTELGGKKKVTIDPELKKVSIAVTSTTTLGTKNIPVTVIDQYGKTHKGSTTIEVTQRTKVSDKDFDWDEAVIYFMVTDRFKDGNPANNDAYGVGDYNTGENGESSYHGGDFAGVTSKLDYLKDLGINTIWITPIVENIEAPQQAKAEDGKTIPSYGYHGYWASNFEELNKHLGTKEEFHKLIDEAHDRGIRIMVDVVLNHSGYDTEKLDRFAGMYRENDIEGNDILGKQNGLPDFATENAAVREKLIKWQTAWVSELGVTAKGNTIDYFRVDTVKHVESTTWAAFKNALTEISPKFKMIGEYYGASATDDFEYLHNGRMDSLLDFSFNDMATKFVTGSLADIEKQLETRNGTLDSAGTFGQFLNSHDEEGFKSALSKLKNEDASAKYTDAQVDGLVKVAAALSITAKGQPIIYYGEEIGLTGENNYPYQTNRYDMKFDNLSESETAMLAHYKKLLAIRNTYTKLFAKGNRTSIGGSDKEGYVAFERSYEGQNAVVALNIADADQNVELNMKDFAGKIITDVYSGIKYMVAADGQVVVTLPASTKGGTAVFVIAEEDAAATVAPTTTAVPTVTAAPTTISSAAVVEAKTLADAKANKKTVKFAANDTATGKGNAIWKFAANDLKRATAELTDIKLACSVTNASLNANAKAILDKDANNTDGILVSFAQQGMLPVDATVTVNAASQTAIAAGSKVYVYHLGETKLEEVVCDTAKITATGMLTMHIAEGGNYVLTTKKASKAVVKTMLSNFSVSYAKTSLNKGKTTTISVKNASPLITIFKNLKEDTMATVQSARLGAMIKYQSANKKIATVSSTGKITAKKKGKVVVKAIVRLSDGQKLTVSKKITVKDTTKKKPATKKTTTTKKKNTTTKKKNTTAKKNTTTKK